MPTFEAPGPGSWFRDMNHNPRPVPPITAEVVTEPSTWGFQQAFRRYGLLISHIEIQTIGGWTYTQPIMADPSDIPARIAEAEAAVAERRWLLDLERFDRDVKPVAIATPTALAEIDPSTLSDDELVDHLAACRQNLDQQYRNHFDFTTTAILPVGDFLASAMEWTGCTQPEALDALQGSAPVSSARDELIDGVLQALDADREAAETLAAGGDAESVLAALRASPTVGPPLARWLAFAGVRLLNGYDIGYPIGLEEPGVLLQALRAARHPRSQQGEEAAAALRARVPAEHRPAFDQLLADARTVYRLRDERAIYCDMWAMGLMRRAVLEAGRRAVERGRAHQPEHAVDASFAEVVALVTGGDVPSADELAARNHHRMHADPAEAPVQLGDPPAGPPPEMPLPPGAARMMRAMGTGMGAMFGVSETPHEVDTLRGLPGNTGVYEGVARVISGTDDLLRLGEGEVLVTVTTSEAFNLAMSYAGAVVTDTGGALSHTSVMCREYGIPAVTGCRDATAQIPDGALVRVDGGAGVVEVLKRP